ncbi:hypothetical protein SKDZ_07G2650 [Saccharomyces kudriavzevii ZP591]|uniref:cysteine synthase n=3 Tax=Saccharomyces TaxID=4930 RepID=J5PR24_SACK1|nr:uncharacterized protein SKDI_07G2660 [Saccharomyces kudriavzevii IFO 1802]EHN02373.1 YGR012W-like protein [Saccharomyces cerevisiae x Saccharomyces kudriavzevii VIN7]CAI4062129.1 hypothetical protein SKDZ_07G2650 [Saccharomyces kudriavzevii ZP591]CAI5271799.1 AIS_HP2_G0019090.mRNA.1.CDS.1 [Saccharomyces cerevisiae]EJT43518.1 YGR012W-like protein [Saccharomyces kudriavzevii IFO 1802]CAI4062090.1 hypothetical protein SKDI_07G2660 [Saccharomyces kudriavzevii IFO 1802]
MASSQNRTTFYLPWNECLSIAAVLIGTYTSYKYYKLCKTQDIPQPKGGVEELIGNTPLVKIKSLTKAIGVNVYAKLELCNPAGSAKDRVALNIIKTAEERGELVRGEPGWVFEGTSGSTGISIAVVCNALGYRTHISLPDDTSLEKLALLESLGATVNKVKPASIVDPNQYVNAAKKACDDLNKEGNGVRAVFADQFENEANWKVHYQTTGPEIAHQTNGNIDAFIAGCGTGGTISGVAKFLKEKAKVPCHVVLADPQGSGFYNRVNYGVMYDYVEKEGTRRRHQVDTIVEGIGLNRITQNFHMGEEFIDESIRVNDNQAIRMAKYLSVNDGLFVGSSTAINAVAAVKVAKRLSPGANIVIIACDSGSRHLSKFWKEAKEINHDISLEEIMNI